jgi:hypothetical protein
VLIWVEPSTKSGELRYYFDNIGEGKVFVGFLLIIASRGIDPLAHGVESLTNEKYHPLADMLAERGVGLRRKAWI